MSVKTVRFAFVLSGLLALSGAAYAQNPWDGTHQRRDEIDGRVTHQNERIREEHREREIRAERREQELRAARAHEMQRFDHDRRVEERPMAARDRSHGEQHVSNQWGGHAYRDFGR